MSDAGILHATAVVYIGCNSSRLLAYLPQLRGLFDGARVATANWLIPVLASASTVVYGLQLHSNLVLMWFAGANALAGLMIAAAGRWLRDRRRTADEPSIPPVSDDFFYAAELAKRRSDFDDAARLEARIPGTYAPFFKAAFLDRVARDERDAMQFQFRPLGPATRVRVRTTGMEGTA